MQWRKISEEGRYKVLRRKHAALSVSAKARGRAAWLCTSVKSAAAATGWRGRGAGGSQSERQLEAGGRRGVFVWVKAEWGRKPLEFRAQEWHVLGCVVKGTPAAGLSKKNVEVMQQRESDGLNQYGDGRSGEKWLGSEYILKVGADGLHVGYEKKRRA